MINAKRIHELLIDSLYKDDELIDGRPPAGEYKIGDGLITQYGLHPARLESHRQEVVSILRQLPDNFMQTKGGGWSFLNMPFDAAMDQWGEQPTAGELCALGSALGLVEFPMPRDMWPVLPGGVPYVVVRDDLFGEVAND